MDTTSSKLALALIKGEDMFCLSREVGKSGHSALLLPAIDELMKENGVAPETLDAVAVNVGPGSFTGIRIGVSMATSLAFATGAKRIAVTSFDIIAYNRGRIIAAVDAGHGNVYAAECDGGKTLSTRFIEADGDDTALEGAIYEPIGDAARTLAAVVMKKAERGEFSAVFEPFYMRRSQAEREKE